MAPRHRHFLVSPTASYVRTALHSQQKSNECISARMMDGAQEFCRLPQPSEGQRRHESRETAFVTHATHRTGHYVGTKSSSGTLFTSALAYPQFRQESWTSIFLLSFKLGDTHSHETRSCGTVLAHVLESKAFSVVVISCSESCGSEH